MEYVYGPVPSRRLGKSLGIDPLPSKTCNYQCIYCQLGKTTIFTNKRKNYCPKRDIIKEIDEVLTESEQDFDYLTLVGSGEPTLYKDLGELIRFAQKRTNKPICVITNGSLLSEKNVRDILFDVDLLLPTLDAGNTKTFRLINRPHPEINFDNLIRGFLEFKESFTKQFWIEVMLVRDVNDSKDELLQIKSFLDDIQPDRIDINVPIRPPVEIWVKKPKNTILKLLDEIFGDYKDINFPEMGIFGKFSSDFEKEFLSIIERHPMRQEQIIETFKTSINTESNILETLDILESKNIIQKNIYQGKIFWKLRN
ncbi:MAG: radical SAM protein [Candidatus Lokiarchaeota archaeon]|nr:radical SAM protein [Candidatus Lokiarchaeota archaeon]